MNNIEYNNILDSFKDIKNDIPISEIVGKLDQGIKEVFHSNKFRQYLDFMSSFYNYSINNIFLIMMQNPEASLIGSYTFWKSKNRYVKCGEHGLKILAPTTKKVTYEKSVEDKDGNKIIELDEKKIISGFKWTTVFDVSQTDGEPLPKLISNLQSNSERSMILIDAIKNISDLDIEFSDIKINGYYSDNKIVIKDNMSMDQTAKTLIHEYVHSILHNEITDYAINRGYYEIQAEGAAYVIMNHYGVDTSEYSFTYVSAWANNMNDSKYKEALTIIQNVSRHVIEKIDSELSNTLFKNREKEVLIDLKLNSIKPNKNLVENIIQLENHMNDKLTIKQIIQGEIQKLDNENVDLLKDISKQIKANTLNLEL